MKLFPTKLYQWMWASTKVPGLNGTLFYDLNQLRSATSELVTRKFSLYPFTCPVVTQWIIKWKMITAFLTSFNAVKQRSLENVTLQENFSGFLTRQQLRGPFFSLLHSYTSSIIYFNICWVFIRVCTLFFFIPGNRIWWCIVWAPVLLWFHGV